MTDKWTLYYEDGSRASENSWPTEDWAEYMAKQWNLSAGFTYVYVRKV